MQVVVIHRWREDDPAVVQMVAEALGVLVFDARQRMAGGGPAVIAKFAEQQPAVELVARLQQGGVPTVLIDTEQLRGAEGAFPVRHFKLTDAELWVANAAGEKRRFGYSQIDLLLNATTVVGVNETTTTTTEHKFSLGKTVMAGGIPMTKKVKSETTLRSEERDEVLCLYAGGRSYLLRRGALNYSGLGDAMQLTRELNFTHLKSELRRLAPQAVFDDRLLKPAGQVRLLGGALDPSSHLDLSFEILALTLR